MITMDVKGINWVGNIYQKFEDMCLEVEEMMYEDTVKYIENQVQTVGATVKKFYSDVVQDLLPPSSCDLDENATSGLPVDQYADVGVCKKSLLGAKKRPTKPDRKQAIEDSRINCDVDNDATASYDGSCKTGLLSKTASDNYAKEKGFDSHLRQYVGSTQIKSSLGISKNQKTKNMPTNSMNEITLMETDVCHHDATVSKPASAEVTKLDSVVHHSDEIENANAEQTSDGPMFVKSAIEKEMSTGPSSSGILHGEPNGLSMDRILRSDDCSNDTVILSHPDIPDTWDVDEAEIGAIIEQGHETMQQDVELKLEETCVIVSGHELQLVPKAGGNQRTKKKNMRQAFSLHKTSARKQEYEQLAAWHRNSEKGRDQNKSLVPNLSETEWELL